jgi:hypothetical protein
LQVIFLARLESGARGVEMIDVDDLLAALIVEDQNQIPDALGMLGMTGPVRPRNKASSILAIRCCK